VSGLALRTDDTGLGQLFSWASETALRHVVREGDVGPLDVDEDHPRGSGTASYMASYWAGYSHRSGFYLRDFCHQAVGAHLLGLHRENAGMIASFLATVEDGWPAWAMNFDGRTLLAIDVKPDGRRVRELPAVFELVETIHAVYRWSADPAMVDAAAFAARTAIDFVAAHDLENPNGVAEAGGISIFDGVASYDESPELRMFEAGDGIAAQYAATRHAAELAEAAGADRAVLDARAEGILRLYRDMWSRDAGDLVVSGRTREGAPALGWHREATWFPPLKGLMHGDPRAAAELDRIDALSRGEGTAPKNVEALTYLPDMYLRNGDPDRAFAWMQRIYSRRSHPHPVPQQGAEGTYPEVSFTLVAQCVAGFLGLEPDAPAGRLTVAPRLPRGITILDVDGIPFHDGEVDVHHGPSGTRVRNRTSRAIDVRRARRRAGFRDPHLADDSGNWTAVAPGETVELSRGRRR